MENEQTLAEKIELLNAKIDVLINEQKNERQELEKKNKILMQRLNKMQEFNEIQDMRSKVITRDLHLIARKVVEIENKLY